MTRALLVSARRAVSCGGTVGTATFTRFVLERPANIIHKALEPNSEAWTTLSLPIPRHMNDCASSSGAAAPLCPHHLPQPHQRGGTYTVAQRMVSAWCRECIPTPAAR